MERLWLKIGEAALRLGVNPKELRYWESLIPEIEPRRSRGNLRFYHVDELDRLLQIRNWLREGLTVADCRELMLTGQLARGLDLDLGAEGAPTPVKRKKAPRKPAPKAPKAPKAPRAPGLAKVKAALKQLAAQLSGPPK